MVFSPAFYEATQSLQNLSHFVRAHFGDLQFDLLSAKLTREQKTKREDIKRKKETRNALRNMLVNVARSGATTMERDL
jgi:hypothetical protein